MLTTTIFPRKSSHVHHGAACSKSGMAVLGRRTLASVPHHNQFLQLDLGLYDLACDCMRWICDKNRSDCLCGAKTAGFTIEVQTLLPREKSCQLIRMITDLGSLEWNPTMEGGALTDNRIKWASSASLPQTSPLTINMYASSLYCLAVLIWNFRIYCITHCVCSKGGFYVVQIAMEHTPVYSWSYEYLTVPAHRWQM